MEGEYTHLTKEERDMIAVLIAKGVPLSEIAQELGRHKSTISRELDRNAPPTNKGYYLSHKAQERASYRWLVTHKRKRLKSQRIREYVEVKLKDGWSPEIIAGRLSIEEPGNAISHEAIYQYIYEVRRDLIACLVRSHRKRMKKDIAGNIRNRIFRTGFLFQSVLMLLIEGNELATGSVIQWVQGRVRQE